MYYSDITNPELQYFHNQKVNSFTIALTDILVHSLFKKVQMTDNIYKIFPLFYCDEITSTNSNDRILGNKCIICIKGDEETYFTFKTDNVDAETMSPYGRYYDLEDKLTTAQFNAFVSMLRHNTILTDNIHINETVDGIYGDYEFDIDGTTIVDTGIIITDETISAQPKVKLSNPVFTSSKYILKLSKLHYTGTNIFDDDISNYRVVETVEIELIEDEWVNIPVESSEENYILNLDAIVTVSFDEVVIQDYPIDIVLNGDKSIIQTDELLDLTTTVKDSIKGLNGQTVYFYEVYEPTLLSLTGDKSIMQTGETLDLTAKLKDEDGSLIEDETIYFYIPYEPPIVYENDGTDLTTLTIPSGASVTVEDGALKMTTSTTGEKNIAYNYDLNNSDNFIFECEIAKLGTSQSVAMYVKNGTTATGCWFAYENSTGKFGGACLGSSFSNVDTGTLAIGDKIKIKQENGVITLYHNDAVIYSKTADLGIDFKIGHYTNSGRIQYIKNIKIIDLNEE